MNELETRALLPAGLRDALPPDAEAEAELVARLMAVFASFGYARVKAPLVEFEEGLLSGPGSAMSGQTFRLMDPVSQRMMGLRGDITPQIARIAATRLRNAPRPLRLSYTGDVLRVKGSQLRPERQITQAGIELIGIDSAEADAEALLVAVEALREIGVEGVSFDLTLPRLIPAMFDSLGLDHARRLSLRAALDHKDVAAVAEIGGPGSDSFTALIDAAGEIGRAMELVAALDLPTAAAAEVQRLEQMLALVRAAAPAMPLTLDPVEHRGFEYHSGICFSAFASGIRGELVTGGRYRTAANGTASALAGEDATGFTLYVDHLLGRTPSDVPARLIYLPAGTPLDAGRALRREGWRTVAALGPATDPRAEARRLGCGHVYEDGAPRQVNSAETEG